MRYSFRSKFGPSNQETIPGLQRKFMNTPLYDYLPLVFSFFTMETSSWEKELYRDVRSSVSRYIDESLQLALFLREIIKGEVKGKGWHIESGADILSMYDAVEPIFFDKVDGIQEVLLRDRWDEDTPVALPEWERALADFPNSKGFERKDKDGAQRLSIEEIECAIESIERCKKAAKKFFHESDEAVAKRFVIYMIDNGVPESREMYRCWYDALDCFYGIPEKIKDSHDCSQEDPWSNYIKAIASRYHKKKQAK